MLPPHPKENRKILRRVAGSTVAVIVCVLPIGCAAAPAPGVQVANQSYGSPSGDGRPDRGPQDGADR